MKNKIVSKKRNVKKKVAKKKVTPRKRKVKVVFPSQWGDLFESMAHREPVNFNFIKPDLSGDPFSVKGGERQGHLTDALRYMSMPGLQSQCSTGVCETDSLVGNEERPTLQNAPERLKAAKATEAVTRGELGTAPAHYSHGKFTPWEVIRDWDLDYFAGNAVKYVCRHKHKGKPVEDIQKAIDCLVEYKSILEKETSK